VHPVMTSRRSLRGLAAASLLALVSLLAGAAAAQVSQPHIAKGERPTRLYTIRVSDMTGPERTLIGTLQGLLASSSAEQIYIRPLAGGYDTWLQDLVHNYGVERVDVTDALALLDHFKAEVDGYLLYQVGDSSINAATSLAGLERAVVVEASIESQVSALGLGLVMDMRGIDEAWVLSQYAGQLNPDVVVEQKEAFEHSLRDYAVLSNALTFYDGNSAFRNQVLDGLNPNSAMYGWGDALLGEDVFIRSGSERGNFTIPADHAHNLSALSGFPSIQQSQPEQTPIAADPDTHYVAFLMTDGDNLQWTLGNLQSDTKWFSSPFRGNFDMGWGLPPSSVHSAPTVMKWYYDNAVAGPGRDGFVAGPSGGGYMYPSMYPQAELSAHVSQLAEWMALGDLGVVEILDFGSQLDIDLWNIYTEQDAIDGLLYLEYGDHSGPTGRVVWSNGKPVIAPLIKLWNGLPESDEATIVSRINQAPRDPTSPIGYSLVIVGVWEHSLEEIQSIINGFSPDTRVVTPGTLVQLMTDNVPHDISFDYDFTAADFESPEMSLVGDAFWATDLDALFLPHPQRLRLTYNAGGLVGSAWSTTPFDASKSWSTIFRFQISYPALGGADGLGFHIQADGVGANPGHEGGNLSSPRFSVVVDTWNNGPEGTDESLRLIVNGNQIYQNDLLDYSPDPNPGSSPSVFRMELSYVAGRHELGIRLFDEGGSDALYDTASGVDLSGFGRSWAGFSAVTGMSTQNHDIRTWMHAGAHGHASRIDQLPNGSVNGCATCHSTPNDGSRNAFGQQIEASYLVPPGAAGAVQWGPVLAGLDADGDGVSNGAELNDPDGTWLTGSPAPGDPNDVTHPGVSDGDGPNELPGLSIFSLAVLALLFAGAAIRQIRLFARV